MAKPNRAGHACGYDLGMRLTPDNLDKFIESVRQSGEPIRFSGGPLDGQVIPEDFCDGKTYHHLYIDKVERKIFHRGTEHKIRENCTMLAVYERTETGAPLILMGTAKDCNDAAEHLYKSTGKI